MTPYTLFHTRGYGSAIVEACLEHAGLPYVLDDVSGFDDPGPERDRLLKFNPLAQLPTLLLPDGTVMTESAAIVLHIADVAPRSGLAPAADDPTRPAFLRWLIVLVGAIYPTFTYGDRPELWVDGTAAPQLRASTDARRLALWQQLEAVAGTPWFLGERFTALDLYLAVMQHWRPGASWFKRNTPRLAAIAAGVARAPVVGATLSRHFGPPA